MIMKVVILLTLAWNVLADQCTSHVLTGANAGTRGIGCVKNGCCAYAFYIASLCAGENVCCFSHDTCGGGGTQCYGTIDDLHPTGKRGGGVPMSQREVDAHINALNALKDCYIRTGHELCIEPAVIAGLASRESQGGDLLSANGTGDSGAAWGILQCDLENSGMECKSCGEPRSCCHIQMMIRDKLIPYIQEVRRMHPDWPLSHQLQGGIAAYNFGTSNVRTWAGLDIGTANGQNDYSNDVVARAQYLKSRYGYV